MKKSFLFTNQQGFFLPYILFITALAFIIVSANVNTYKNELDMMYHLIDQVEVDSLLQMSSMKYSHDIDQIDDLTQPILYRFPSGEVSISYISHHKNNIKARFEITTNDQTEFTINNTMNVAP